MHLVIDIEASELGYAYEGVPHGKQHIDIDIAEELADKIDLSDAVKFAVSIAVNDYRKLAETYVPEH